MPYPLEGSLPFGLLDENLKVAGDCHIVPMAE